MTETGSTSTHLGHPIDAGVPCSGAGIARRFERTVPVSPDSPRTTPNPARTSPILHPAPDPRPPHRPPPQPPRVLRNLTRPDQRPGHEIYPPRDNRETLNFSSRKSWLSLPP